MGILILHLLLLALLTGLVRGWPRVLRTHAMGSDVPYHLLAAQRIRENQFCIPDRLKGLFFPSPYNYPPLLHFVLAYCPRRYVKQFERVISAFLDIVYVWLCYGFTTHVLFLLDGHDY